MSIICRLVWFGSFLLGFLLCLVWFVFGLVFLWFGVLLCFGLVCFGFGFSLVWCFALLCFGLFVLFWFFFGLVFCFVLVCLLKLTCDEWGGAESRGSGARPVEFNDNERPLRHSPVSSPTEELRKDKRRSDDSARRERSRPGPPASLRSHGSRPCPTRHITILHFCYFHMSIICNYIVLHLSQTQTFNPNNEISS